MKKIWKYIGALVVMLILSFSYKACWDAGVKNGLDMMHEACYNSGGLMIGNHETGKVIQCAPFGMVDPEELRKQQDAEETQRRNNTTRMYKLT